MATSRKITVWSPKGGVGTSTVAAAIALIAAESDDVCLVDRGGGDIAPILGMSIAPGGEATAGRLVVLDRQPGEPCSPTTPTRTFDVVVVDNGTRPPADTNSFSVCVLRADYLALRRLVTSGGRVDRLVLVLEEGRALQPRDVAACLGHEPIVIPYDVAVARSVDAGLFATRLPDAVRRSLRKVTT
jgi:hypothetical protein